MQSRQHQKSQESSITAGQLQRTLVLPRGHVLMHNPARAGLPVNLDLPSACTPLCCDGRGSALCVETCGKKPHLSPQQRVCTGVSYKSRKPCQWLLYVALILVLCPWPYVPTLTPYACHNTHPENRLSNGQLNTQSGGTKSPSTRATELDQACFKTKMHLNQPHASDRCRHATGKTVPLSTLSTPLYSSPLWSPRYSSPLHFPLSGSRPSCHCDCWRCPSPTCDKDRQACKTKLIHMSFQPRTAGSWESVGTGTATMR